MNTIALDVLHAIDLGVARTYAALSLHVLIDSPVALIIGFDA